MFVEVYGLGHIGVLSLLYLAQQNVKVRAIDLDPMKVNAIRDSNLLQQEPALNDLMNNPAVRSNICFERDEKTLEISYLVCVGSPSSEDGSVDLSQVHSTIDKIITTHPDHIQGEIILRSTVPPGTCQSLIEQIGVEKSNLSFIYFPEFIRTGESLSDLLNPSLFVYASSNQLGGRLLNLFPGFAKARKMSFQSCEYLKYVSNSWHALKVSFANEVAAIGDRYGVDSNELFEAFLSDHELNISEKYLRPGPPYGGPCLNKEVAALSQLSKNVGVESKLISSINLSNDSRVEELSHSIDLNGINRVILFGSGFRPGTEDVRSSVALRVIEKLEKRSPGVRFQVCNDIIPSCGLGDLIILGSLNIARDQALEIQASGAKIFDLGYFKIHKGM